MILIFWTDATTSATVDAPSGFTQLYSNTVGNRIRRAWYKVADGSEGTSINVTGGAERSAHTSYRILAGTYQGNPVAGTVATGTDESPNPPSLTPSWGSYKTLWIASAHSEGDVGDEHPLSYSDLLVGYTGGEGSTHAKMMTARRFIETAMEDPGVFSLNMSRNWAANTVAIQGANTAPAINPFLKIMPLGDSVTRGGTLSTSSHGAAGYRRPLINLLKGLGYTFTFDGGYDIDFIGTQLSGNRDLFFDREHNGFSGFQIHNPESLVVSLYQILESLLTANPPDAILLHVGTNDPRANDNSANMVNELNNFLDLIYSFDSDIYVILAKIINRGNPDPQSNLQDTVSAYNDKIQTMADDRISQGDKLLVVDMETGAGINYDIDSSFPFTSGDMTDNLHPNDIGYDKMAAVWFDGLVELLTPKLSLPSDESTNHPQNTTFEWNPALGAATYHLQVATDFDFEPGDIYFEDSDITDTFAMVSLELNVQYYWRVRAKINTGISPFSEIWNLTTVLPVELSTFNVKLKNNTAELSWRTETEVSNFGFEIERAVLESEKDKKEFLKIGFVEGSGNSNSPKNYSFTDKNLYGGSKFIYRLKQIDTDGTFAYSYEVELTSLPDKFELSQNYPNPFNPSTRIEFSLPVTSEVRIDIFDILGQHVSSLMNKELEAGYHSVVFNAENLSSGTYIYRLTAKEFIQTKKMVFIR